MCKWIHYVLLLCFVVNFGIQAKEQQQQSFKKFSGDISRFIFEVNSFSGVATDDETLEFLTFFKMKWDSMEFSTEQQNQIVRISNLLIEKKIRANPDYLKFLRIIFLFNDMNYDPSSFQQWMDGIEKYLQKRKSKVSTFIQILNNTQILVERGYLNQTPSSMWVARTPSFKFLAQDELIAEFETTDLVCYAKNDSFEFFNTTGILFLERQVWEGNQGLITWERAGYDRTNVNAVLGNYSIDLAKTGFKADSVIFTHKTYFDYTLLGVVEVQVERLVDPSRARYPQFDSYKKEFFLKDLYRNVDYQGGFSMQGSKLVGKGDEENKAMLYFYRRDTLRLKASSNFFVFRPENVVANNTAVSIYLEKDSIYHGNLFFSYQVKLREINLLKSTDYTAQSPYSDSYHKLDLNFDQLVWRINEPELIFTTTPGSAQAKATFESLNFFNYDSYIEVQLRDDQHPLFLLKQHAKKMGENEFSAQYFVESLGRPLGQMQETLFRLAVQGYIYYDPSNDWIELKDKCFNTLDASVGRIDYDVIRFNSITQMPLENARLNLLNLDLAINGIPYIQVSDSQEVRFFPSNNQILLKYNRNFQFDGTVQAGLFTFYGKKFIFNYDTFKLTLNDVDSIRIKVITGLDNFNKPITRDVSNLLNGLTGELFIDDPGNKSGLKNFSQYPLFRSKGNSYVYYDDQKIYKGVYSRSKFYFKVFPFEMDSLDNFKKEAMSLKGELTSADIFPTIQEPLVLQPDFSLGFKYNTPQAGLPIYKGKGQFYQTIHLSNQGLRGLGTLNYLTSNTISDDFIHFPDSSKNLAKSFTISALGSKYADVNGINIRNFWKPYQDQMFSWNTKEPFDFFNKQAYLGGQLELSPDSLIGKGNMDLLVANSASNRYVYGNRLIKADTMSFHLRSLNSDGFTVITNNVKGSIDYNTRLGNFRSNSDSTIVQFPENKYLAYLQDFTWYMDRKELEMKSNQVNKPSGEGAQYGFTDDQLIGARFVSTKFDQDSLSFVSPVASYDYSKNILRTSKVEYIDVADARVFPKTKLLTIRANAIMDSIPECTIMASRSTRYHLIHSANSNIQGRYKFTGAGKYDYKDENNQVQVIYYDKIEVDTAKKTIATGSITEPDNFTLSPNFAYQGKVEMYSSKKYLRFKGGTRLNFYCPSYASDWIRFDTTVNPNDIQIPINQRIFDLNLNRIYVGTYLTVDSIHIYSNFFGGKKNYNDGNIVYADGLLSYVHDSSAFVVGRMDKKTNPMEYGGLIAINTKTCMHTGQGPLDLNIKTGQVKITNSGILQHDLNKNQTTLDLMIAFDFWLNATSLAIFAQNVDSLGTDSVDITLGNIRKNYNNLIGMDASNRYYMAFEKEKRPAVMPQELNRTIVLTDLKLLWDQRYRSYRSVGPIGVGIVNGKQVNARFKGYMEITRKRTGDYFDLYLKLDDRTWYYFGYTRGVMQVLSSNKKFIDPITLMKPVDRIVKAKGNMESYTFLPAPERKVKMFLKRAESFGKSDLEIQAPQEPVEDDVSPSDSTELNEIELPINQ